MLKNKYFYLSLLLLITLFFYYDYRVSNLKSERQSIRDNLSSITKDYDILKKKYNEYFEGRKYIYRDYNKNLEYRFQEKKILNYRDENLALKQFVSDDLSLGKNPHSFGVIKSSSYIDFFGDNIYLITGDGLIYFSDFLKNIKNSEEKIIFSKIQSNLDSLIKDKYFYENTYIGIKDIKIIDNEIYISHSNKVEQDCYNTALLKAEINYEYLTFEKYFSPNECVTSDNPFTNNKWSQGGRIVEINGDDNNKISMSQGTWGYEILAQNPKSLMGKIILVEDLKNYKILSSGHRNIQGLYFDKKNNLFLETEHGPRGGDEVNIIKLENDNLNFGWPISSYGDHVITTMTGQGNKVKPLTEEEIKSLYDRAPMHKTHVDHGFNEPVKYFEKSAGISDIVKISNNENLYVYGTMRRCDEKEINGCSLYFIKFDENHEEVLDEQQFYIGQRVRDLTFINQFNILVLFLENENAIGIIDLKKLN
jgi:hypothetical protein